MVCRGTACHVRGASRILDEAERCLDIKEGETTEDLEYSLETVACIGACGLAPAMMVNDDTLGNLTPKDVRKRVLKLKSKALRAKKKEPSTEAPSD